MTTQTEALKLALEALEGLFGTAEQFEGGGVAVWRLGGSAQPKQAITAIKESLAQPAQEPQIAFNPEVVGYVAPQRTWVGLTDEEIRSLWDGHVVPVFGKNGINPIVFARAIEAKLKEKNNV